jgi:uroporphyrin-III C-methyltransferase/precorrin-2 dehydrogenase/sirohydrochlorin ferrochelatase
MGRKNTYFFWALPPDSIDSRLQIRWKPMQYFPVFLDLQGQDVLVVGGGVVAERKIRALVSAGAVVQVVARTLSEHLQSSVEGKIIRRIAWAYDETQLTGKRLVFAATDDVGLNRRIFRDAERLGVPANVVDDKAHCRFISPAVVDRSPVMIAISTSGTSPVLARRVRKWIERVLPQGLGKVAQAAGDLRNEVKKRLTPGEGRRFWEASLADENLHRWSTRPKSIIRAEMKSVLGRRQPSIARGMVYLVGAGPGHPDLLTLRALDVIGRADVVLYDRLVSEEILELVRRDADRIYVGKRAGHQHCRQEEIHRIMLDQAAKGRTVVRLKGGDAFIFGRGGEELEALRQADIPYEVVPGITAATGCAAYAGIPLTHRAYAQSVTFVTGQQAGAGKANPRTIDWASFAGEGKTAVVYMGLNKAEAIRTGLLEAGISAGLPVALVEDGSLDSQRVIEGTVGCIPALARQGRPGRPGLLVVGQVAALAGTLGWLERIQAVQTAA